jgi:nucleotide-binding universal stress UspA family protein
MLRRLLLALDQSPAAREARSLTLALAQHHGATLVGLAIVDPDLVAPAEPTPMGGDAYKQHKDTVLIDRARAAAQALAQSLTDECRADHVEVETAVVLGPALASLIAKSAACDIVVIGGDGAPSNTLIAGLLRDNPRPLIVTPGTPATTPGTRTLFAYDGSVPAMRVLQLFAALRLRVEHEAVVVSAHADAKQAAALAETGAAFLRERDYKATTRPIASTADPEDTLIAAATDADAGLIVAGSYGHRGWREWLLGTTTEELLAKSPVPLFIHH